MKHYDHDHEYATNPSYRAGYKKGFNSALIILAGCVIVVGILGAAGSC